MHTRLLYISGPYLTAVDLADIATQLDEDERERMAEGDVTSQDYQEFLKVLPYYLFKWLPPYNGQNALFHEAIVGLCMAIVGLY